MKVNFNGVVIANRYDLNNQLTNCSAPAYKTTYAYNVLGLRTNMTDASGTTAYFYNSLSQLTNKTVTWSGQSPVTLNYRYDSLGSLTNVWSSTANGVSNAYQFDLLGRITNVLANGSSVVNYSFDAVGNLQTLRYANGVTNLYQYDAMNRLTNQVWKLNNTTLANFAYTLGATGNRTASSETVNGTSRIYAWSYDYLYRLTSESIQNIGTVNYQFDAVGNRTNRTSSVSGLNNQNFAFNPNDWQTNTDNYDSNGNTIGSSGNAYQYDVLNHLTNVNSGTILIAYDGDGNRVKKTVGGVTTYYLVDDRNPSGYAQVLEQYQGASLSRVYNYGLALISQRQVSSGTVSYYCTDGHGSTRFLLNTSGGITDTYTYDSYGVLIASTGSTPNSYLYCGQQYDSDLQMYYLRARYYKPDYGRFWTMDSYYGSSQDPLSLHKYLYCYGNPINSFDPSGHDLSSLSISMSIGASIGALSSVVANVALGRAQTFSSIFEGAAFGAVLGPAAVLIPEIGVAAGAAGIYGSGSISYQVFTDPNATLSQKVASISLVVASIWGTKVAIDYNNGVGFKLPVGNAPAPGIPNFPLPLRAPSGIILESAQGSLSAEKISQLPTLIEDMVAGKQIGNDPLEYDLPAASRTKIPTIGGYKDGNRYIIREGNHRMVAALEYYKATGDPKYVYKFLETGNWTEGSPTTTWKMTQDN